MEVVSSPCSVLWLVLLSHGGPTEQDATEPHSARSESYLASRTKAIYEPILSHVCAKAEPEAKIQVEKFQPNRAATTERTSTTRLVRRRVALFSTVRRSALSSSSERARAARERDIPIQAARMTSDDPHTTNTIQGALTDHTSLSTSVSDTDSQETTPRSWPRSTDPTRESAPSTSSLIVRITDRPRPCRLWSCEDCS